MLYSTGALPETFLEWLIERRLRGGPTSATAATPKDATAPVGEEAPQTDGFDDAVLSTTRPGITVAKVIVSSTKYPLQGRSHNLDTLGMAGSEQ